MIRKRKLPFHIVIIVSSGFDFDESEEFWQGYREAYIACDKETRDEKQKE